MHVLRKIDDAVRVVDPRVRALVELRFSQVCDGEPFESAVHGYFVVAEPGDRADDLERETGCPVLHDTFCEVRFGHPDFTPATEALEEHPGCFELVFVFGDDGAGVTLIVPKVDGMDPELLAMCAAFAVPAAELSEP